MSFGDRHNEFCSRVCTSKLELVTALTIIISAYQASALASDNTCDGALAQTVVDSGLYYTTDFRTALLLDSTSWQTLHDKEGATGTYDGITLGETYDQFQSNVQHTFESYNMREDKTLARNILWAGLSGTSAGAYETCINGQVLLKDGQVHLAVKTGTDTDIAVEVNYDLVGNGPRHIALTWSLPPGVPTPNPPPPSVLYSGPPIVQRFVRPTGGSATITANSTGGYGGDSVTVTPVPPTLVPVPPAPPSRPPTVPIYRFSVPGYSGVRGYYFATSVAEGLNLHLNYEKMAFRLLAIPDSNSEKMFQCQIIGAEYVGSVGGDACPPSIEVTLHQLGYASGVQEKDMGMVPIVYCWNKVKSWHLLSIDPVNECDAQGAVRQVDPYAWVFPPTAEERLRSTP